MLRKTPWQRTCAPKSLKLRLSAQATLIALSALLMSACSTPQGSGSTGQHKVQSAHSNDIWQRIRDNFAMPELENQEVYARENYYATRADYVGRMAMRSGDFLYLIMDEVERRRMPSELALLPFVESAFVTTARSPVSASGLWQFMPATGRDFSLQQNRFADQRNDVMASTNAALDYLQRLYDRFGDWHLALAAYNWGQGNINRAVNRSVAAGGSGKYTEINMPAETRQYVPKLQAIKNIVRNPAQYGISLPNISNRLRHEAVLVTRDIDVSRAAELANLSEDEFKRLNPAYKRPVIVAALNSKILVPADRADDFRRAFSDKHRQLASLTTYTTYSTEALADIASKYNTDENRLRELNDIPYSHSYVRADSTLIVPRTRATDEISYLALNSSVRSTTGDIGITDYNSYSTPTLVADAGKSTSSSNSITAPGRSSTGLVADTSDADQLGTLINNTPSTPNVPTYVPTTVASTITPSNTVASAPTVRDTIVEPRIETPATTTIATTQTNPNRATGILTMPPVAKSAKDPIAQLTAGNTSISNDNTTETSQLTAQATDTGNNTQAVERIAENNDVITEPTTQIADAAGTTNASHVASASNTPATPTLSTTEKIVAATAVSAAVSTANEPNRAVVRTNYRVPQTPQVNQAPVKPTPAKAPALVKTPAASQNKAAVANTKPSAQPAKANTTANKPALKANNKPAEKVSSKASASAKSAPVKPDPKKVESKPALKAPPPNTAKTKVANTQQTTQKPATSGKMPSKVELKKAEAKPKTASASKVEPKKATEVSKTPAKMTPTAATKTAVKSGNTSSVKPAAVVTPKKK